MNIPELPEGVARVGPDDSFSFLCHRDVACFTDCCRQLELALTPYDVLRLRQATNKSSAELLENYIIVEQDEADTFPRYYLTMVDDGQASCVFLAGHGCGVYQHRPGACRTYPMGRAVRRENNRLKEFFVLLREPHCLGFQEQIVQNVESYSKSQELESYNRFNDMFAEIQQHEKIRNGMRLSAAQLSAYKLALYDIDTFRQKLGKMSTEGQAMIKHERLDDEALLTFNFRWLKKELFGRDK